ncbi:hypothetical protein M0R45_036049 [Rubus argutus]|uniref:Uncharacterized protein n=1 Tax=Rubus argutus TaxID=59490 RepID=A0AAW1VYM2_RUBAR
MSTPSSPTPVQPDEPSCDACALCPMPSRRYPTQSPCSLPPSAPSAAHSLSSLAAARTTIPGHRRDPRLLSSSAQTR